MRAAIPFGVLLLAASSAHAEHASVIFGDHADFGRLVIQLAGPTPATIAQRGNKVEISTSGEIEILTPDRVPRNVLAFRGGAGKAVVTLAFGARVKHAQSGRLIIVDVLDPRRRARGAAATAVNRPNPAWTPPALAAQDLQARPLPLHLPAPSAPAAVSVAPAAAEQSAAAPALPQREPLRLLAGPEVGAVAFRRAEQAVIVFDDIIDLERGAADPEKSGVTLQHRQGGTIVTLPLADGETLALARDEGGWVIRSGAVTSSAAGQASVPDGIAFQFNRPGRTMTISDPVTGQLLLLGTLRQPGSERSLVDARRAAPGYVLLPTWFGLALEASSDAVDLRVSPSGFTLQIPDKTAPGTAVAAVADNQFRIPSGPTPVLMRKLDAQIASAATAPPRGRGRERVAAARTMLALGMSTEAAALLTLAANDDPQIAADPETAALQGIAAVLAGRPDEATGLDNASLPARGDVALWRGVRDVAQGKPNAALAGLWPALATYPEAVRSRIAPTVVEAAIENNDTLPPSELEGPALAIARARHLERSGDLAGAIDAFTSVANGRDERDSVRASVAAAELRLKQGSLKPAEAADAIERQTVRWRGDGREERMRLRAAELRQQAGQWRAALEILRETETLFPGTKPRVATMIGDVFRSLLAAKDAGITPLEFVTIAGEFADRLPDGEDSERLAALLAEKLAALDLPSRAIPVLQRLADQTQSAKTKAEYALRLAQLQLDAGDAARAEAGLTGLAAEVLTPPQSQQRLLLLARARAGRGDPAAAAETLAALDDPANAEIRAGLLAKAGDWRGSLGALKLVLAGTVPETGDLNEQQQDLVLREATAAVHAGDADTLKQLKRFASRLKGPRADLFNVLTATAVESPDDLPRAKQELAMTRALPERLNALKLR